MPIIEFIDLPLKHLPVPPYPEKIDYWKKGCRRFGLRISWSGHKSWVYQYRFRRRTRRITFGSYPEMKLAEANARAEQARRAIADGRDPAAEKYANDHAKTFADLCDDYMKRHAIPKKKTWKEDQRNIDRELLPRWRYMTPSEVTRAHVREVVEAVYDRGAHTHANRVLALIHTLFQFAVSHEVVEHNPAHGVKRPGKEHARDRVLSPEEIRKVWNATENEQPPIRAKFRLQLLTAQRGGEVQNMRWNDIDLDTGWWTIPAEFSKNGLSHRVPLNSKAVAILRDLRSYQEQRLVEINAGRAKKHIEAKKASEWVFPSRWDEGESLAWTRKANGRIREASGVEFRPHDLRRTAASLLTGNGISRLVVSKILNHKEQGVTAVYDRHSYDGEKRTALDAWGRQVESILADKRGTTVLQFNRA